MGGVVTRAGYEKVEGSRENSDSTPTSSFISRVKNNKNNNKPDLSQATKTYQSTEDNNSGEVDNSQYVSSSGKNYQKIQSE